MELRNWYAAMTILKCQYSGSFPSKSYIYLTHNCRRRKKWNSCYTLWAKMCWVNSLVLLRHSEMNNHPTIPSKSCITEFSSRRRKQCRQGLDKTTSVLMWRWLVVWPADMACKPLVPQPRKALYHEGGSPPRTVILLNEVVPILLNEVVPINDSRD